MVLINQMLRLNSMQHHLNWLVSLVYYYNVIIPCPVAIVTYIDDLIGLKNAFVADLGSGCGMLSTAIAAFEPTTSVLGKKKTKS